MGRITDDLQNVLEAQDPQRVDVLIEAEPDRGDGVRDILDSRGIDNTRVSVRNKTVFEATLTPTQIDQIVSQPPVLRIDHSPTFSPLGAIPGPGGALPETEDAARLDLKDITEKYSIEEVWEQAGTRGREATVGVIDTPVEASHPAIEHAVASQGVRAPGETHGTWVVGAIAARETESRRGVVRGLAPEAEVHVYGALAGGGASVGEISEGIDYLLNRGVDYINLSLGGPHTEVLQSVVQTARDEGAAVVTSAGNAGPAPGTISCPGHHDESICVGSVKSDTDEVAAFSGRGPGFQDDREKPDVMAYGGATRVGAPSQQVIESILGPAANGGYAYLLGTSMAAPQVTAMGALRTASERASDQ